MTHACFKMNVSVRCIFPQRIHAGENAELINTALRSVLLIQRISC